MSSTGTSNGKRTCGITPPQVNPNWAKLPLFNRKNWSSLRFGEIVENVNERVEPSTAAETIYVGLDDLDSGSLHIRRWGKGSDVIGTKLGFRKGDVIFGRRRAYQRKLAVAEVEGICSAHAMVARAKPKVILPEFLPFLMMSDKFMNRAVDISVGSLSPTINWTTLKLEEFDLPPLDQQRRIAEILWAVDGAVQREEELLKAIDETTQATAISTVFPFGYSPTSRNLDSRYNQKFAVLQASELFEVLSGNGNPPTAEDGDTLYFKVNDFNLNSEEVDLLQGGTRFDSESNSNIRIFPEGTVVFPKRGASIFLNKVGVVRREVALDPNMMGLIPNEGVIRSEYLYWLIKLTQIGRIADTTSLPQLNHKHLTPLVFPVPSLTEQDSFLLRAKELRDSKQALAKQGATLKAVHQSFTDTIFSP